jgi:hypothetical protein
MGLTLSREGHHLAALEYFASVSRQMPVSWTARQSYASTLYNCAQEVRTHLGRQDPSTRSSVERVAMVRASMNESKVADSIATTPQEHAVMAYQRGQTLHSFGLVTNALVEFRRAAALDSSSILIAAGLRQAERRLARGGPAE